VEQKIALHRLIGAMKRWFTSKEVLGWKQVNALPHCLAEDRLFLIGEGEYQRMRCHCGLWRCYLCESPTS
jgi:hypothetical protein